MMKPKRSLRFRTQWHMLYCRQPEVFHISWTVSDDTTWRHTPGTGAPPSRAHGSYCCSSVRGNVSSWLWCSSNYHNSSYYLVFKRFTHKSLVRQTDSSSSTAGVLVRTLGRCALPVSCATRWCGHGISISSAAVVQIILL